MTESSFLQECKHCDSVALCLKDSTCQPLALPMVWVWAWANCSAGTDYI